MNPYESGAVIDMNMGNNSATPASIAPAPRYKIGYRTDEWGERSSTPGGIPDPAGAWVRYDDHAAALSAAQDAPAPDEPDWRHPKIQGLIGSEARLRITIDLIWQILEDPNQEFTASDMEYWDTIHDKLKAALSAAQDAPAQAAQAVPQGWVMVPKEPTPEMLQIGRHAAPYRAVDVYRAMLAAAPAAPQPAAQQKGASNG